MSGNAWSQLNQYYDVLQLLKRFGVFIYTGSQKTDIEMMMSEVKELYDSGLLMQEDYLAGMLILKQELAKRADKN